MNAFDIISNKMSWLISKGGSNMLCQHALNDKCWAIEIQVFPLPAQTKFENEILAELTNKLRLILWQAFINRDTQHI